MKDLEAILAIGSIIILLAIISSVVIKECLIPEE